MTGERLCIAAFAALAVAGAAGARQAPAPPPASPASPLIVYACPGGETVRARYPDATTAVIEYRGRTHTLKTAVSADGARYIGDGLQWWTKGTTMGMISALGPGAAYAEPGPECRAPGG